MFLRHLIRWPSADIQVKFYGDRPWGTPPSGELNTRGVAKCSVTLRYFTEFGKSMRCRKRSVTEFMQESIVFSSACTMSS